MRVKEYPIEIQKAILIETNVYMSLIYAGNLVKKPIVTLEGIQNREPDNLFDFEQGSNLSLDYTKDPALFWDAVTNGDYNLFFRYYIFPPGVLYKTVKQNGETFNV